MSFTCSLNNSGGTGGYGVYLVALMKAGEFDPYKKAGYEIKKAIRKGYYYDIFLANRYLNDMVTINQSAKERQGKPMPDRYQNPE